MSLPDYYRTDVGVTYLTLSNSEEKEYECINEDSRCGCCHDDRRGTEYAAVCQPISLGIRLFFIWAATQIAANNEAINFLENQCSDLCKLEFTDKYEFSEVLNNRFIPVCKVPP